jgi:hypothetical protein
VAVEPGMDFFHLRNVDQRRPMDAGEQRRYSIPAFSHYFNCFVVAKGSLEKIFCNIKIPATRAEIPLLSGETGTPANEQACLSTTFMSTRSPMPPTT